MLPKVHEGGKSSSSVWERWCDIVLDIDPAKAPDPVEVANGAEVVHGLRWVGWSSRVTFSKGGRG